MNTDRPEHREQGGGIPVVGILLSVALHLGLVALIITGPIWIRQAPVAPLHPVAVSLVAPEIVPASPADLSRTPPEKPVVIPEKKVRVARKKKALPVSRKRYEPRAVKPRKGERRVRKAEVERKILDGALKDLERRVEKDQNARIEDALSALREKVASVPATRETPGRAASAIPSGGSAFRVNQLQNIYLHQVADQVQRNWAFVAGPEASGLVTSVVFHLDVKGRIRDLWFTEHSGNGLLDESARKAILKAEPFPPHPEGLAQSVVIVALKFTPEGVL